MKKMSLAIVLMIGLVLPLMASAADYKRPKEYDEREEEALKIQKQRAERRHQMDLELIDRGYTPEQVQQMRQERANQEKMRRMQREIASLKARQNQ